MPAGNILVIAADPDFRKSLAFALEAEGYAVAAHGGIPARDASRGYDCTILDHRAAAGPRDAVLSFCRTAHPVLLLSGSPQPWLQYDVFAVIDTPLSGDTLMAAVRLAVAAPGPLRTSTK